MAERVVIAHPVDADIVAELDAFGPLFVNPGPEPLTPEALKRHCCEAEALMAFMTEEVDAAFLEACPRLKLVAGAFKGADNVDLDACSHYGVAVTVVPDLLTEPTAELALGLMIAMARNVLAGDRHVRSGAFAGWRPKFFGTSVYGATVGIIGAGAIGRAILRLLSGFRGTRLYTDLAPMAPEEERELGARFVPLDHLAERSDFIVLAVPLAPATVGLVDARFLDGMKPGAFLINPARGSVVDEAAVAAALEAGRLGGYAADVFAMEDRSQADRPTEINPDLRASSRTVLTPHLGSALTDVRRAIARAAALQIVEALSGRMPSSALNASALVETGRW